MDRGKKRNKRLYGFMVIGVSIGLLAGLVSRLEWDAVARVFQAADGRYFTLAAFLATQLPLVTAWRWLGTLQAQGAVFPFARAVQGVMIAAVLNSFLPSKGGDLAKVFFIRHRAGLASGAGTVVLERLVDLFCLGLLGLLGYALSHETAGLFAGLVLSGGVLAVFVLVLRLSPEKFLPQGKARLKASEFRLVFLRWSTMPGAIAQTLAGSLANWLLGGLVVVCLLLAFGRPDVCGYGLAIYPIAVLVGLVPVSISGVGTRDTAFALFLAPRIGPDQAILVGLGYTVIAYWFLSLFALPFCLAEIRGYLRSLKQQTPDRP